MKHWTRRRDDVTSQGYHDTDESVAALGVPPAEKVLSGSAAASARSFLFRFRIGLGRVFGQADALGQRGRAQLRWEADLRGADGHVRVRQKTVEIEATTTTTAGMRRNMFGFVAAADAPRVAAHRTRREHHG